MTLPSEFSCKGGINCMRCLSASCSLSLILDVFIVQNPSPAFFKGVPSYEITVGTAIWMLVEFVVEAGGLVSMMELSDNVTLQLAPQTNRILLSFELSSSWCVAMLV